MRTILQIVLLFVGCMLLPSQAATPGYEFNYQKYILFHWKGALTSHSMTMKVFPTAELTKSGYSTFLILYTKLADSTLVSAQIQPVVFPTGAYPVSKIEIDGLDQATEYFYTFVVTSLGVMNDFSIFEDAYLEGDVTEFNFKTFDIALKPYSFTFGAASCAKSESNSPVFTNLVNENLDFFLHIGDLHYDNIDENNINKFYNAYHKVFSMSNQRSFFESTPVFYLWDDHDFGPNDAKGTSPSKPAATSAYLNFVPHSPLKSYLPDDDAIAFPGQASQANKDSLNYLSYNTQDYGIFRSFIVGRCLFIIMDLRSFLDVMPGDILGEEQRTWLENQIRFAGNNDEIKMTFLVSSIPWIDIHGGAVWEDFMDTQEWIGTLVKEYIYDRNKTMMLIAGDAHMIAFDDGRNNRHGGFPVVQAAALDRTPSCKGGPYSHGVSVEKNQYSVLEVTDDGNDNVCVKVNLKRLGANVIEYDTCHPELYPFVENTTCPHPWWFWASIFGGLFVLLLILGGVGLCWYRRVKKRRSNQAKAGNKDTYNVVDQGGQVEGEAKPQEHKE